MDETKRHSVASKKVLVEKTRNFMKLPPEQSVTEFMELLKAYQLEVESLSKRCKTSESAFVHITGVLTALPDPVTLSGSPSDIPAGRDMQALREEVKDLEAELMKMKNQEVTVRRLEARLKELESQKDGDMGAAEAEFDRRRNEMEHTSNVTTDRLQAEIDNIRNRNRTLETEMAEMNKSHFSEKTKFDQLFQAKQDEINALSHQVETLQDRLAVNAGLTGGGSNTVDMYKELVDKSEDRIRTLDAELAQAKISHNREVSRMSSQLDQLRKEKETITSKHEKVNAEMASVTEVLRKFFGSPTDGANASATVLIASMEARIATYVAEVQSANLKISDLKTETRRMLMELQGKDEEVQRLKSQQLHGSQSAVDDIVAVSGGDDVVSIVQAQRDRFRTRVLELETERDSLKQNQFELNNRISVLAGEKKKVETERNFWKSQNSGSESKSSDVELGAMGGHAPPTLASVKRRIAGSHDMEQSVTSLVIWGLGNPVTRRAGLVYILTLHLLVLMVLYRLSSIVSSNSNQ